MFKGQRVQVVGEVNGEEVVVQFRDGHREPALIRDLVDPPKPAAPRPIITKGLEQGPGTGGADNPEPPEDPAKTEEPKTETPPSDVPPAPPASTEPPAAPTPPASPDL